MLFCLGVGVTAALVFDFHFVLVWVVMVCLFLMALCVVSGF